MLTGIAPIATMLLEFATHPAAVVTVTPSDVLPDAPTVNVIARVPEPDVIDPLVTVQV